MKTNSTIWASVAVGALLALGTGAAADAATTKHVVKKAAAPAATAADIEALKAEIAALKAKLEDVSASQAKSAEVAAQLEQAQDSLANSVVAQSQTINTMPAEITKAAVAAAQPKTDKIYYKGVKITLGGFVAAEADYRSKSTDATIATAFAKIPFGNANLNHVSESRFSAQQSRFTLLAEGDASPTTHIQGYGEVDFLGAAQTANFNQSNSFTPRFRVLYANVDFDNLGLHLLAGQNWSLATMNSKGITPRNEVAPPQIDPQYLAGFVWARQPQIRLTEELFDKSLWLAVSVENPATLSPGGKVASNVVVTSASGSNQNLNSANSYPLSNLPDVIVKGAYETKIADRALHVEAFAIGRDFYSRRYLNPTNNTPGSTSSVLSATNAASNQNVYGVGFGGGATFQAVPHMLDVQASILSGRGMGRYGTSGLADVTTDVNGNLKPLSSLAYLVGGTFHASPMLDIYAFGGSEQITHRQQYLNTAGTALVAGYGNEFANNTGCSVENSTCAGDNKYVSELTLGFWHKPYVGSFGRVQWGMQFSNATLGKFSGNNASAANPSLGAKTTDNMLFTSIRYYPF